MVVLTQIPGGLRKLVFEKNNSNLIGGLPLVRFVNYSPKKPADEKLSFINITFPKSVTKNSDIFSNGNMEAAIKLVMIHETILTDL